MGGVSVRVCLPGQRSFTVLRKDILRAGLRGGERATATPLLREVVRLSLENGSGATIRNFRTVQNAEKAPTAEAIRAFQEPKATGPSAALHGKPYPMLTLFASTEDKEIL